jgi:hypothetical protein
MPRRNKMHRMWFVVVDGFDSRVLIDLREARGKSRGETLVSPIRGFHYEFSLSEMQGQQMSYPVVYRQRCSILDAHYEPPR